MRFVPYRFPFRRPDFFYAKLLSALLVVMLGALPLTAPVAAQDIAFAEETLTTSANGAQSVTTADVDGDGDLDVLLASSGDDTLRLFRNQSPPLAVETLPTGFPGETLTVDLVAGNADFPLPNLFGAGVTLTYDPALIQYVSATPGSFLDLAGEPDSSPLFDALGRRVAQLMNTQQDAGTPRLMIPASDLSSGHYFVRVTANGVVETRRLTVVR